MTVGREVDVEPPLDETLADKVEEKPLPSLVRRYPVIVRVRLLRGQLTFRALCAEGTERTMG